MSDWMNARDQAREDEFTRLHADNERLRGLLQEVRENVALPLEYDTRIFNAIMRIADQPTTHAQHVAARDQMITDMFKTTRERCGLTTDQPAPVRYGCHVDIEPGLDPDECVMDFGAFDDCRIAKKLQLEGKCKTDCPHWKPVATVKS